MTPTAELLQKDFKTAQINGLPTVKRGEEAEHEEIIGRHTNDLNGTSRDEKYNN